MDFSILIAVPTLNSSKELPALIKSLDLQTFTNWAVLFIDGSNSEFEISWLKNICKNNKRYSYLRETNTEEGLYGAMNQAFNRVKDNDWLVFWGADDFAFSENTIELISRQIEKDVKNGHYFDLIIFKGNYFSRDQNKFKRVSYFSNKVKHLNFAQYNRKLFFGASLPHQATIFSPKVRRRNLKYNKNYKLAADLEYFLNLSTFRDSNVKTYESKIVAIGDTGVSSKKHFMRTYEVVILYVKYFKVLFFIPFLFRYLRRIISFIEK